MDVQVGMPLPECQPPVPQRARGKILMTLAADLPVKPGIGFEETLIGGFAAEHHLAVRADLCRHDLRGQHIF